MHVVIEVEGHGKRRFVLEGPGSSVVVGRATDVAVSFPDTKLLSRRHCEIKRTETGIELSDLGSSNGTLVNGKLARTVPLRSGDLVRAGDLVFRVELAAHENANATGSWIDEASKAGELRCQRCGRLVSMATIGDGQSFEWGATVLCGACKELASQTNRTGVVERMLIRLHEEGFTDIQRLSPEGAPTPVYRARRRLLGDLVAIKALPIVPGLSEKKIKRFETEASAMARIKHPNVVQVFDVKQKPELVFLVMEHVAGETLLQRIDRDKHLPATEALEVVIAIARALEAAHAAGIIHRNVKPANILIASEDGRPKLVDFGLAKGVRSFGPGVTDEEETLGTIRYVAPEQLRDARVADHRADLYSLAATLFHALTGKLPYPDKTDLDLLQKVVGGKLPTFDPTKESDVPPSIGPVLAKALAKSPADRHETMAALRADLVAALGQLPGGSALAERIAAEDTARKPTGLVPRASDAPENATPDVPLAAEPGPPPEPGK